MLKPSPDLEPQIRETLWWGDEAVDRDASAGALPEWTQTGDTGALVLRQGVEPSPVEYRALTVREISQLPLLDNAAGAVAARCYEAARFGVQRIKGMQLRMSKVRGIRGLADESLDELTRYHSDIPIMLLHDKWLRAEGYEPTFRSPERPIPTDFAHWIGGLILDATFRSGRGTA